MHWAGAESRSPPATDSGPQRLALSPRDPLRQTAAVVLEQAGSVAALSGHTVLVPHDGLLPGLVKAFAECAGGAAPLPRLLTLPAWLAQQPVPPVAISEAQRVAELQRELAARPWLAGIDHWAMAAELAGLFDELGRHQCVFPETAEAFAALLERAHMTQAGTLLRLDAQLVHSLWHASEGRPDWGLSAWQRDALAMKHVLDHPEGPLWVFDAALASPQAVDFLTRYARSAAVTLLMLDPACEPRSAWVKACFDASGGALADRASAWSAAHPLAPAGVGVHATLGREGEAAHVCSVVCEWLAAGKSTIAVVATDRALARRLRALLERLRVTVADNAGWSLATTRVGAAVRDLLRLQRGPTPVLLQACIDSPLFAAGPQETLRAALRPVLAKLPPHSRLDRVALIQQLEAPEAVAALQSLYGAIDALGERRRPLHQWVGTLLEALHDLAPDLETDSVGAQLLSHLTACRRALARAEAPLRIKDFADWLDWTLGDTLYRDAAVDSPVLLTHPAALRGMTFDAIVVAGADAAHLPAARRQGRVVRDAARLELGLPDAVARRDRAIEDWCLLLGSAPCVEITWQTLDDAGEHNPASPFLLLMQRFHSLAYGSPLPHTPAFAEQPALSPQTLRPAEIAQADHLPAWLSPTRYQALLDCPYRWFVASRLGLHAPADVREHIDPRDFGEVIHHILSEFHRRMPLLSAVGADAALSLLESVSEAAFAPLIVRDFGARAWLQRWRGVTGPYVAWQMEREQAGWRVDVDACEREVRGRPDALSSIVGDLSLLGKPDRVDTCHARERTALPGPDGAATAQGPQRAVIDYKTGARSSLEGLVRDPTEDAQLVLYAGLLENVTAVAYLPVGGDAGGVESIEPVSLDGDGLREVVDGHLQRLATTWERIAAGEPLRAIGDEAACRFCHVRGICRHDHRD